MIVNGGHQRRVVLTWKGTYLGGEYFELLVLLFGVLVSQLQILLAGRLELVVIVLHQVLHDILIHRVGEVDDLIALLQQLLREGAVLYLLPCFTCSHPTAILIAGKQTVLGQDLPQALQLQIH